MIDLNSLTVGQKLGCKYTYTAGAVGTFSNLGLKPNNGRKIKDPLVVDGSYFKASGAKDPKMISCGSAITMLTTRELKVDTTIMSNGTKTETKDSINVANYKNFISMTTAGTTIITAIPNDQLVVTKDLISVQEYVDGINSITVAASNLFCKVAISTNNTDWQTYDPTSKTWVTVDLTQTTDVLKTKMADYTDIAKLTATDYAAMKITNGIGIALLIGIDGTDTTKTYSVSSITVDYVGTDGNSSTIQMFNFVYAGRTKEGYGKFIADKPIQTNINYTTLYNAGLDRVLWTKPTTITNSEIAGDFFMRMIDSAQKEGEPGEYDQLILGTSVPRGTETIEDFWDTNIGSFTRTISCYNDDFSIPPGGYIVRGSGSDSAATRNVAAATTSADYGYRPVLIIRPINTPDNAAPAYTVVNKVADLGPGKCIECEYTATANAYGTFMNLGKATKGYLKDRDNSTPDGRFAFNFVGYTKEGKKILMADRVIQTGICYNTIIGNRYPNITGLGISTKIGDIDGYITLPSSSVDAHVNTKSNASQYEDFINSLPADSTLTTQQVWHTEKAACYSKTWNPKDTAVIVKGFSEAFYTEEDKSTTSLQRVIPATDYSATNIGFRPVFVVENLDHIEGLKAIPYTAYSKSAHSSKVMIEGVFVTKDGVEAEYKIVNKTTATGYNTLVSALAKGSRSINAEDLIPETDNTLQLESKDDEVLATIIIHRDKDYRISTTRYYGNLYGGSTLTGVAINGDRTAVAAPSASYRQSVVKTADGSGYVTVGFNTGSVAISKEV